MATTDRTLQLNPTGNLAGQVVWARQLRAHNGLGGWAEWSAGPIGSRSHLFAALVLGTFHKDRPPDLAAYAAAMHQHGRQPIPGSPLARRIEADAQP